MLTRQQKAEHLKELIQKIAEAKSVVVTSYRGLKISDMAELRDALRAKGVDYKVVKNALLKRAFDSSGRSLPEEILKKPLAVAFDYSEDMNALKAVYNFSLRNELLEISGGVFEGELIAAEAAKELAKLPGREALYSMLLGSVSAPMTRFVNVFSGSGRALADVLRQFLAKKQAETS